jgi:hypothetical protein
MKRKTVCPSTFERNDKYRIADMTLKMHNNALDDDFEWKYSNEGNPYISSTRKTHNVNKCCIKFRKRYAGLPENN